MLFEAFYSRNQIFGRGALAWPKVGLHSWVWVNVPFPERAPTAQRSVLTPWGPAAAASRNLLRSHPGLHDIRTLAMVGSREDVSMLVFGDANGPPAEGARGTGFNTWSHDPVVGRSRRRLMSVTASSSSGNKVASVRS